MENLLFENVIKEYFNYINYKLKKSTYITNTRKINKYILPFFKGKYINNITMKDFLNWQIYIEKFNFKFNYKSSLYYCFNNFLEYCVNFYDLNCNIAKKVGNFRNDDIKQVGNIWTLEEYKKFIENVDDIIYKTLFELLFFTGLRKCEALALTFNDINNNIININKQITRYKENNKRLITTPKTISSIRKICIDNELRNNIINLKEYYKNNYNDFNNNYFIFGGKNAISETQLKRKKDFYCDKANVKRIKIHEFRHSHACLLFMNNVPIEDISNRLGHSSISITMDTYLKFLPKDEKRVINTLNSLRLN